MNKIIGSLCIFGIASGSMNGVMASPAVETMETGGRELLSAELQQGLQGQQLGVISGTGVVGGTAPISGSIPISGQVPLTGSVPLKGEVPISGSIPISGSVPLSGNVPVSGQVPFAGQLPVSGALPVQGNLPLLGNVALSSQARMASFGNLGAGAAVPSFGYGYNLAPGMEGYGAGPALNLGLAPAAPTSVPGFTGGQQFVGTGISDAYPVMGSIPAYYHQQGLVNYPAISTSGAQGVLGSQAFIPQQQLVSQQPFVNQPLVSQQPFVNQPLLSQQPLMGQPLMGQPLVGQQYWVNPAISSVPATTGFTSPGFIGAGFIPSNLGAGIAPGVGQNTLVSQGVAPSAVADP